MYKMNNIKFEFRDLNKDCCEALKTAFSDIHNINVVNGNICQGSASAVVTAGNSFGYCDGGIDGAINTWLSSYDPTGDRIDVQVRSIIHEVYYGEQPLGTCLFVPTKHLQVKWLLHVPTMKVPEDVSKTYNAYIAFRAVLVNLLNFNKQATDKDKIKSVLCSAFCTAAGCMSANNSAKQMRMAWDSVVNNKNDYNWKRVHEKHRELKLLTN